MFGDKKGFSKATYNDSYENENRQEWEAKVEQAGFPKESLLSDVSGLKNMMHLVAPNLATVLSDDVYEQLFQKLNSNGSVAVSEVATFLATLDLDDDGRFSFGEVNYVKTLTHNGQDASHLAVNGKGEVDFKATDSNYKPR